MVNMRVSKLLLGELWLLVCKYKLFNMSDPSQKTSKGPKICNRISFESRILARRKVERAAGTVSTRGFYSQG